MPTRPTASFVALALSVPAFAEVTTSGVDTSLRLRQPTEAELADAGRVAQPFGVKGQTHWLLYSGAAFSVEDEEDAVDVPLTIGYSTFIVDDVEFSLELSAWGHFQDGDDAAGINPGFNFRWHFLNREKWTLFTDAGIGVLVTTDNVPDTGTSFNFTPRLGLGGTYRLTDAGLRLIGGVRWHHISNARIEGERRNPDRDGVLVYLGVMFPF